MARSSIRGFWRIRPTDASTSATLTAAFKASFDPTSMTQVSLGTLPKGAIPLQVTSLGGATGGTNPTVDIGTSVDPDGFANELDADDVVFGGVGALTGVELTTDTEVFGQVGASAATGGTVTVLVNYIMSDNGTR